MHNLPLLIGLSGKAGSGKSTVGDYLAGAHGYAQFAFAGALKEVVQTAFHFTDEQMAFGKEVIDLRVGKSPRWCLQYVGTSFREIWPQIWISGLIREICGFLGVNGQRPLVVTDVRFRDEALALQRLGALLVRVERPGGWASCFSGIPGHVSETALDNYEKWDYLMVNGGSLADLGREIEKMLSVLSMSV
jgi:hypothetical protein